MVSSVNLQCDKRVLRRCALGNIPLTIVTTVCGIVERVARLPVVSPWSSRRLAHILLVVTLELFHVGGVAQMLRDDKGARLRKDNRDGEK